MSAFEIYPKTREKFIKILEMEYPGTEAKNCVGEDPTQPENLLWLLLEMDKIKKNENEREHCARAGRWIGYVDGILEATDLIQNEEVCAFIRADIEDGNI